jgi:acyl carrier protein
MTSSVRDRLLQCFTAVFPAAQPAALENASAETFEDWDSVAHVTLITVLEEEFGAAASPDRLAELTSFESLLAELEQAAR